MLRTCAMASVVQKMENTLTCPICTDVFRQPVTLSCQHSYCKECLQMFSETARKQNDTTTGTGETAYNTDDTPYQIAETPGMPDVTSTNEGSNISSTEIQNCASVIICCPVCRKWSDLGNQGVAGLPINFILAEIVETCQAEHRIKEAGPLCGMCEGERRLAVKACSTCKVLYCHDCLFALHPNRGPLREHVVIHVDEYLSQQKAATQHMVEAPKQGSDPPPTCEKHYETLSIYCVTCQEMICTGCLYQHDDHTVSSIETACEKQKDSILEKTKVCEETKDKVTTCIEIIQTLIDDIKRQEMSHKSEIQRAYDEALQTLERWRSNALEKVEQHHNKWLNEWKCIIKDLQMQAEEMETLVITTKKITSGNDFVFSQEAKMVSARIDDHLQDTRNAIRKQEDMLVKCNKFLKDDAVPFIYLSLTEKNIKKPMLKFTDPCCKRTKLKEGGLAVEEELGGYHDIYTDGHLQSGQYLWELEVTMNLCDNPDSGCSCYVGVEQSYAGRGKAIGGKTFWGVGLDFCDQEFQCYYAQGCSKALPEYRRWRPSPESHNLCFYLDCDTRTFTIIDCSHNQIMYTESNIDVSEPLSPFIGFNMYNYKPGLCASARLISKDNTALQTTLTEVFKNT